MGLEERPREKIRRQGASSLSNAELLAVLIRVGVVDADVVEVARNLLAEAGWKLANLYGMSAERMQTVRGIGPDKVAALMAAFELGRRWLMEKSDVARVPVKTAETAWRIAAAKFPGLDHEEFWAMYMNRANYVLSLERISSGNISGTTLDMQRILKRILDLSATGLIVFHNHPSGNPRPGSSDILATTKLKDALFTMGKQLLDHIIVADSSYYSFSLEKVIDGSCANIVCGEQMTQDTAYSQTRQE